MSKHFRTEIFRQGDQVVFRDPETNISGDAVIITSDFRIEGSPRYVVLAQMNAGNDSVTAWSVNVDFWNVGRSVSPVMPSDAVSHLIRQLSIRLYSSMLRDNTFDNGLSGEIRWCQLPFANKIGEMNTRFLSVSPPDSGGFIMGFKVGKPKGEDYNPLYHCQDYALSPELVIKALDIRKVHQSRLQGFIWRASHETLHDTFVTFLSSLDERVYQELRSSSRLYGRHAVKLLKLDA